MTLVVGVLLVAALTLLPWQSGGPTPTIGGGTGRTAIQSPAAWAGIAAAVAVASLVAWLAAATLPTRPPLRHPGRAALALAAAAFVLIWVKLLLDADELAIGAAASVVLGGALLVLPVSR